MKIGIVTITELDNFGNRLQNYALQTVLNSLGATVETIPNYITYQYRKSKKYQLRELTSGLLHRSKKKISPIIKQLRFERFDRKYFTFSPLYSTMDYISPELDGSYDLFIAGSDQIWNPYFPFNLDFNFLQFAQPHKRIAYAASFGVDKIPEKKRNLFQQYLQGMQQISTREYAGAQIVKDLTGKTIPVLPDPTLLLSKDEWCSIEKKPHFLPVNKKYILQYCLGQTGVHQKVISTTLSSEKYQDCILIDIGNITKVREYSITPDEFIWLIHHAELLITDSFHGTVFSILMQTPFLSLMRSGGTSMGSRLDSLFQMLHLEQDGLIQTEHTDNIAASACTLSELRVTGKAYLSEVLNTFNGTP